GSWPCGRPAVYGLCTIFCAPPMLRGCTTTVPSMCAIIQRDQRVTSELRPRKPCHSRGCGRPDGALEIRRTCKRTVGSNPTLSARYATRPERGVLRIWRRGCCGRTHRFDKFVRNEFGRPQVGPVAQGAEG